MLSHCSCDIKRKRHQATEHQLFWCIILFLIGWVYGRMKIWIWWLGGVWCVECQNNVHSMCGVLTSVSHTERVLHMNPVPLSHFPLSISPFHFYENILPAIIIRQISIWSMIWKKERPVHIASLFSTFFPFAILHQNDILLARKYVLFV